MYHKDQIMDYFNIQLYLIFHYLLMIPKRNVINYYPIQLNIMMKSLIFLK